MNALIGHSSAKRGFGLLILSAFLLSVGTEQLFAQFRSPDVEWELLTPTLEGERGEIVYARVRLKLVPKAHIYTPHRYEGNGPVSMEITTDTTLHFDGELTSDIKPIRTYDPNFSLDEDTVMTEYWKGTVTLTVPLRIAADAPRGKNTGWSSFLYMTCDDKRCIPPMDQRFEIELNIRKS